MPESHRNWAGNYTYSSVDILRPKTVPELREIIVRSDNVRALGTRHSFNAVADGQSLVSLEQLNRVAEINRARRTVTVEAGIRYGELGRYLHREGFALHNLASLPHICVAGACATATHGSGERNGNLATAVVSMELMRADGEIVSIAGDQLRAMIVGLGGFGIVTQLTLAIEPTYSMRQHVYENLSFARLEENFDALQAAAYSVSLFTDWRSDSINQVWLKKREPASEAELTFFGATLATTDRHPIAEISAENCTPQMGVIGPWHERLPHFRLEYTPSSGEELQSEYFVPREHAMPALRAVSKLSKHIAPLLLISEIRTIASDELWMSPCYQRPSVAIHFTWKQNWPAVRELLRVIEAKLDAFDARPHWGKLFTMSPARLRSLYPKLRDFRQLLRSFDPRGKFGNAFLAEYIFGSDQSKHV